MTRPVLQRKKAMWAMVAQSISAVGTTPRNARQCRKRWDDLRLRVRSLLAANQNLNMATGGGAESPIKLQLWKEICAATIGTESIEGVGDMERGAPTSGDAGSHSDSADEDTGTTPAKKPRPEEPQHCPSTSGGKSNPPQQEKSHSTAQATAPMSSKSTTSAPLTSTIHPVVSTEGNGSAESSTISETAATAAISDNEEGDVDIVVGPPAGNLHSPYLSPCSQHDTSIQGQSPGNSWPATPCPIADEQEGSSIMDTPQPSATGHNTQESMLEIIMRQQQLAALLTQHVTECASARGEMRECADTVRSAIESTSKDICAELAAVRRVLSELVQTMRDMRTCEQPSSSSAASSSRTSPICRSGQNLDQGPGSAGDPEPVLEFGKMDIVKDLQ
ncbi:nuclear apoptosis-inducing factor 1-like [Ambystoma mexicanum]|uniref:nuclear apoptosis-inducing factor 1-like n=1 Tax=Ambystoma mexicanum TaxID=8296 RepID=UPI0037E860B9